VKRLVEQAGLPLHVGTAMEDAGAGAHRVGVQVFADAPGAVWAAGARECSIPRGGRTLIEESSSPVLGAEQEGELRAAAVDVARSVGYRAAGTVEFRPRPLSDESPAALATPRWASSAAGSRASRYRTVAAVALSPVPRFDRAARFCRDDVAEGARPRNRVKSSGSRSRP